MQYRIYYKMNGIDIEYKYATTVGIDLLSLAVLECFEDDVTLLIIEHNIKIDMDNPIPMFMGSNQQFKKLRIQDKTKVKGIEKTI